MTKEITFHRASTETELQEILNLQAINHKESLSLLEKEKEGFVTLSHTLKFLKQMNDMCAHCVAKCNGKVIGYALSMHPDFKNKVQILEPMFAQIDEIFLEKKLEINYIAMGQICIDKNFRGQGVFKGLYNYMREQLNTTYDMLITDVDVKNIRSSNAHKAVGFEVLKNYHYNNQDWELIIWKWK